MPKSKIFQTRWSCSVTVGRPRRVSSRKNCAREQRKEPVNAATTSRTLRHFCTAYKVEKSNSYFYGGIHWLFWHCLPTSFFLPCIPCKKTHKKDSFHQEEIPQKTQKKITTISHLTIRYISLFPKHSTIIIGRTSHQVSSN